MHLVPLAPSCHVRQPLPGKSTFFNLRVCLCFKVKTECQLVSFIFVLAYMKQSIAAPLTYLLIRLYYAITPSVSIMKTFAPKQPSSTQFEVVPQPLLQKYSFVIVYSCSCFACHSPFSDNPQSISSLKGPVHHGSFS